MTTSLMVFHAIISILLIVSVLLQFGKGAEAGLMSSASESVFTGSQQGNILSKITTILTIIFLANCIFLAKLQSGKESKSILDTEAPVAAPLSSDSAIPAQKTDAKEPTPVEAEKVEMEEPTPVKAEKVETPEANPAN